MSGKNLFTGEGDTGLTHDTLGCSISKNHPLMKVFGKIDSLQSILDKAILESSNKDKEVLEDIQKKLWQSYPMMQNKAGRHLTSSITRDDLKYIEDYIEGMNLEVPNSFKRFKTYRGVTLNECRVRCREAEIMLVPLLEQEKINSTVYSYFNRLSSLFYAMSLKKEKEFD